MELKVSVDNTIRLVCGLNEETTVQDVIFAIANSIKQTGRFYLIEKLTNIQNNSKLITTINEQNEAFYIRKKLQSYSNSLYRMPRILAPNEKLIDILTRVSNKNELIEFHLFKSKYSTSNDAETEKLIEAELLKKLKSLSLNNNDILIAPPSSENYKNESFYLNPEVPNKQSNSISSISSSSSISDSSSVTDSLFKSIYSQQLTLEEQSVKLDDLFKLIETYEIANLHLSKENETFKTKLSNLEAINKMNASKLTELERETNEESLNKELELNEYLVAQRDYYERKLNELQASIENKKQEASDLTSQLNELNKELEQEEKRQQESLRNSLDELMRQSEINNARLDCLDTTSRNIDKCLSEKYKLIELLESELNNNNNNNNNRIDTDIKYEYKLAENSSLNSAENNVSSSSSRSSSSLSSSSSSVGDTDFITSKELNRLNNSNGRVFETRRKIRLLKQANSKPLKYNKLENIHYF